MGSGASKGERLEHKLMVALLSTGMRLKVPEDYPTIEAAAQRAVHLYNMLNQSVEIKKHHAIPIYIFLQPGYLGDHCIHSIDLSRLRTPTRVTINIVRLDPSLRVPDAPPFAKNFFLRDRPAETEKKGKKGATDLDNAAIQLIDEETKRGRQLYEVVADALKPSESYMRDLRNTLKPPLSRGPASGGGQQSVTFNDSSDFGFDPPADEADEAERQQKAGGEEFANLPKKTSALSGWLKQVTTQSDKQWISESSAKAQRSSLGGLHIIGRFPSRQKSGGEDPFDPRFEKDERDYVRVVGLSFCSKSICKSSSSSKIHKSAEGEGSEADTSHGDEDERKEDDSFTSSVKVSGHVHADFYFCDFHEVSPEDVDDVNGDRRREAGKGDGADRDESSIDDVEAHPSMVEVTGEGTTAVLYLPCFHDSEKAVALKSGGGGKVTVLGAQYYRLQRPAIAIKTTSELFCLASSFDDCSDVVVCCYHAGKLGLENCEMNKCSNTGVLVAGGSSALVSCCSFSELRYSAVHLLKGAIATVRHCKISEILGSGLDIETESAPLIHDNTISKCSEAGISLRNGGVAKIVHNSIFDIVQLGVVVMEDSAFPVVMRDNQISGCGKHGIAVVEKGELEAYNNKIFDVDECGILVHSGGTLRASKCIVVMCSECGIAVENKGTLQLTKCEIRGCRVAGVLIDTELSARVQQCSIHECPQACIKVVSGRKALIFDNNLRGLQDIVRADSRPSTSLSTRHRSREEGEDGQESAEDLDGEWKEGGDEEEDEGEEYNAGSRVAQTLGFDLETSIVGVHLLGEGGAVVRSNRCSNGLDIGVLVNSSEKSSIESNEFIQLKNAGVCVLSGEKPSVVLNFFYKCSMYGVLVAETAQAVVERNVFKSCKRSDVYLLAGSSSRLEGNIHIECSFYAVEVLEKAVVKVEADRFFCNYGGGLLVHGVSEVAVQRSKFWSHPRVGVHVKGREVSDSVRIESNEFKGNARASIVIESGANPLVKLNLIHGNEPMEDEKTLPSDFKAPSLKGPSPYEIGTDLLVLDVTENWLEDDIDETEEAEGKIKRRRDGEEEDDKTKQERLLRHFASFGTSIADYPGQVGALIFKGGEGHFEMNEFVNVKLVDVDLGHNANPVFINNQFTNSHSVVRASTGCMGFFRANEMKGSRWNCIFLQTSANPTFVLNRLSGGLKSAVVIGNRGRGNFENNTIENFAEFGVLCRDSAEGNLFRNKIARNGLGNVICYRGARTAFQENVISKCSQTLFVVQSDSHPIVEKNTFEDGEQDGLLVHESGKGRYRENSFSELKGWAVVSRTAGDPLLEENTIQRCRQGCVLVEKEGKATLRENALSDCSGPLLRVQHGGVANIVANRMSRVQRHAVEIVEKGSATLSRNAIEDCGDAAVYIDNEASAVLENNKITKCKAPALVCTDRSDLEAKGNEISHCTIGVFIGDQGQVSFINNTIRNCSEYGLHMARGCRPVIQGNTIFGMAASGIKVESDAEPMVLENDVHNCERGGLIVSLEGKGTILRNRIHDHVGPCITIRSRNHVELEENEVFNGKQAGILIHDGASPIVKGNRIYQHKGPGLKTEAGAFPKVVENAIYRGTRHGIYVSTGGGGEFVGNKVHNNKGVGIKVTSRENPVFVENKIYANSHFGIHVHDNGVATVEKNEILDDELACVRVEGKGVLHCRKNLITGGLRSGVLVTDEGRIFMEGDVVKHHKRSSVEIQSTGVGSEPSTEISSPGSDRSKSAVLPTVSRLRNCLISAGSEAALLVCNNGKCSVVECRLENTTSTAAVVIVEQGGSLQLENSQVDAQSSKDAFYVDDESVLKQVGVNVREILSKAGSDESKTASGEAKAAEE